MNEQFSLLTPLALQSPNKSLWETSSKCVLLCENFEWIELSLLLGERNLELHRSFLSPKMGASADQPCPLFIKPRRTFLIPRTVWSGVAGVSPASGVQVTERTHVNHDYLFRSVLFMMKSNVIRRFGDMAMVKRILTQSPNLAGTTSHGGTPLKNAVRNTHMDIVRYLVIEAKCPIDDTAPDVDTAIHIACMNGTDRSDH